MSVFSGGSPLQIRYPGFFSCLSLFMVHGVLCFSAGYERDRVMVATCDKMLNGTMRGLDGMGCNGWVALLMRSVALVALIGHIYSSTS